MKASELILKLQEAINTHGDLEVIGKWEKEYSYPDGATLPGKVVVDKAYTVSEDFVCRERWTADDPGRKVFRLEKA